MISSVRVAFLIIQEKRGLWTLLIYLEFLYIAIEMCRVPVIP